MKLEIALSILGNISGIACALSATVLIGLLILTVYTITNSDPDPECKYDMRDWNKIKAMWRIVIQMSPAFIFIFLLALIPSVDDLWKVRIGLIKLELASPENIQKSTDEITRIAKKLECKYLGCEKEK
jgi:hypothetical protein